MARYIFEQTDIDGDTLKMVAETDAAEQEQALFGIKSAKGHNGNPPTFTYAVLTRKQLLGLYHMIGEALVATNRLRRGDMTFTDEEQRLLRIGLTHVMDKATERADQCPNSATAIIGAAGEHHAAKTLLLKLGGTVSYDSTAYLEALVQGECWEYDDR